MKENKIQNRSSEDMNKAVAQTQVREALLLKKDMIIAELKKINSAITRLQEEYSKKREALQSKRKPSEEALHHIDALLKLEGYVMNSTQNQIKEGSVNYIASTANITDVAYDLLSEIHKPLHYKEIFSKLHERGLYIPGKNPSATLLSRMSRDSRFKRTIKRGTYALSSWRVRAAKSKRKKRKKKNK